MRNWKRSFIALAMWAAAFAVGYAGYSFSQDAKFTQFEQQRETVRKSLGTVQDIATAFRSVDKVVEPSVVKIEVRKKLPGMSRMPFDEDMLRRFFRDREGNNDGDEDTPDLTPPPGGREDQFMPEQIGTGSGVIMEVSGSRGFILTNNHVAGGAEEMTVTLADGREFRNAKLVGADAKTDLAVISIEADRLSPAKWGDSDSLQKGDWILAFGAPFGYVGSMTHGIVSAMKRSPGILGQGGYEDFIQVDAPINPGNSGGPLVNLRAEVVGINTAIASRTGGFQGIGFAIPSSQAKFVYNVLKEKGKVVRGWLGVGIDDVAKNIDLAHSFGYDKDNGVVVMQVLPGTPAVGKLQKGDIITEVNGKPVDSVFNLRAAVAAMAPGTDVPMKVFRNQKLQDVTVKLGEQPENLALARGGGGTVPGETSPGVESLGVRVQNLTPELANRMNLDVQNGALITNVARRSAAERAGLRPGDAVTEVNNKPIKSAQEFIDAMRGVDLKKGVRLYVASALGSRYMYIKTQ